MERGKRVEIKPVDEVSNIELTGDELINIWMNAGRTLEEATMLSDISKELKSTIGSITAEESCNYLKEAMGKYNIKI